MSRSVTANRIGVYGCEVCDGEVVFGAKWVTGYYGLLDEKRLTEDIIPRLEGKRTNPAILYPLLVVTYVLSRSHASDELCVPKPQRQGRGAQGSPEVFDRPIGFPLRRKFVIEAYKEEAVIYADGSFEWVRRATSAEVRAERGKRERTDEQQAAEQAAEAKRR
jgi:hypothetical protein